MSVDIESLSAGHDVVSDCLQQWQTMVDGQLQMLGSMCGMQVGVPLVNPIAKVNGGKRGLALDTNRYGHNFLTPACNT
jgi:hypothetical protein